jgi:hypothetical protein
MMGLLRLRLRAERRDAKRWIGAILLLALAGGAALVAAQAARRTDTAFGRALDASNAADAIVNANTSGQTPDQTRELRTAAMRILDVVHRSPFVVDHGLSGGAAVYRVHDGKFDTRLDTGAGIGSVAYEPRIFRALSTARIHAGRLGIPDRADEITITPLTAKLTGWRVGTNVTELREYEMKDFDPETGSPRLDRGTHLNLKLVGIVDPPEDLLLATSDREPHVYLTPAFARQFPESVFFLTDRVRLRRGAADLPALRAAVAEANRAAPDVSMPIAPITESLVKTNRANDPLVNGLWMLAALFALIGVLLTAQSLGRSLTSRADDHAQLRALGGTRLQRFSIEAATLAAVILAAAVLAAMLAYVFSALTPIGAARDAEPHPGISLNAGLSLAAIGVTFAGTMLAALPTLRRVVTRTALPGAGPGTSDPRQRRSHVADLVARSGLRTPAVVGTRLALQPGLGANATPVRSVLASLVLVVATVTATFAFGANLQRWTTTPHLYGWNWDAAIGSGFGSIPREAEQTLAKFPNVVEAGALNVGELRIAGLTVPAIGIDPIRGTVAPRVEAGRLPRNTTEIALGARTMRALHTHIGDTVAATIGATPASLRVVGRTTFPAFGNGRGGETGLGTGALGTASRFPVNGESDQGGRYNYMLLRFAPGTAAGSEQQLRELLTKEGCTDPTCLRSDSRPAEIDGYRSARMLPLAIGIVLVLLLVATLAHVLVSTMRRRSDDLAILRALGCTPRNLVTTMRWQSLVLTSIAIVIGIPCGLVANRVAWAAFSRQLGIATGTVAPLATLAVGAAGLLVLALVLATAVGLRVPGVTRRHRLAT